MAEAVEKLGVTWKQTGQFSTKSALKNPWGITLHPDGDVAITSCGLFSNKAKIFSKDGHYKYSFAKASFDPLHDIAITPDNRYILLGKSRFLFYDSEGKQLGESPNATNGPINTLAVDSSGRIIAGLPVGATISIHNGDGSFISKFAIPALPPSRTPLPPRHLGITSNGDIAVGFEFTLQLMDYSGNNVRVVQRPQEADQWHPQFVCCRRQGEIFVVNGESSVYRYTADGKCLGRIISGLDYPKGIAITEDGQQLYIVETRQHVVKIFQRQ